MSRRVVFVCNALRIGGSQSVFLELVRAARDAGFDVVVASRGGALEGEMRAAGARLVRLVAREGIAGEAVTPASVAKTAVSGAAIAQLTGLAVGTPTVFHASQPWPVGLAAVAACLSRSPLIWHAHGTTRVEMPPAWMRTVRRTSAAWIGITPEVIRALADLHPLPGTRVARIPTPIDLTFPATECADPEPGVIGVMSTLTPNKVEYVQACLRAARELNEPVHVRIVGDGPARPEIERQAEALRGGDRMLTVSLHGAMTDPWRTLRDCELVVGMGLVALEAAARGHRVICASSEGVGGRLSADTYDALSETNFTGRGMRLLTVDALTFELREALGRPPDAATPTLVRAAHGPVARAQWVALWQSVLR